MRVMDIGGIIYYPYEYKNEAELQDIVEKKFEHIFGEEAVWFPGTRIGAGRREKGAKGIPDGFVVLLDQRKWVIVEVELSSHPLHDHVAPQVSRFSQAWRRKRKDIADYLFSECERSEDIQSKLETHGITSNQYKFIADIVDAEPDIVIIIDEYSEELEDLKAEVKFKVEWSILKAYVPRANASGGMIFSIDAIGRPSWEKNRRRRRPSSGKPVRRLRFLGKAFTFKNSTDIPVIVANELVREGLLKEELVPWGPGRKRYLVSTHPKHPMGNPFRMPAKLTNGLWVERHASEGRQLSLTSRLIKHCGIDDNEVRIESM